MNKEQIRDRFYEHLRSVGVQEFRIVGDLWLEIDGDEIVIDGRYPIKSIRVLVDLLAQLDAE